MKKMVIEKTNFYHITHGDKKITIILEDNKKEMTLLFSDGLERDYKVTKRVIQI